MGRAAEQLKKAIEIVKKHGAENWTRFGQIQEAVYGDPKMQALMVETGKIATWEIYTAQTLEL